MSKSIQYYGELFNKGQNITPEIRKAIDSTIPYGIALMKQRSPVKTGALKAGWKGRAKGQGIEWTNEVPYTIYQEMGTKYFPARAMLTSSMTEITAHFMQQLNRAVGKKFNTKQGRSLAQNEARLAKAGAQRAGEMTSSVPKFSAPGYAKLTGGGTDIVGGFK